MRRTPFNTPEPVRPATTLMIAGLVLLATMIAVGVARANERVTLAVAEREGGLYLATEEPAMVVAAPQVKTEVTMTISGPIARTKVRQHFTNPRDRWLEGIYTFPLPEDSAVDRLMIQVGERRIEGEIQEKERARKTFEKAKRQGKRTGLVSQERPNIFSTEVANIGPGETIVIEIEYQETLRFDAGRFSMRFPMVVRPRYVPGTPLADSWSGGKGWSRDTTLVADASRITPPVADPAKPSVNPLTLKIDLDPGFPLDQINSPYHPVRVETRPGGRYEVSLQDIWVATDRDFELNWEPRAGYEPSVGIFTEEVDGKQHAFLIVMPPADLEGQGAEPPTLPREVIFILDKSGSMGGAAIVEAKAALSFALDRLTSKDSFNIIAFDSAPTPLFANAQPLNSSSLSSARRFLQHVDANGGTEMMAALNLALDKGDDPSRLRQIIFITDGAVGNEAALMTRIRDGLRDSRLFTVGISAAPNSHFMTEAAEAGRGSYTFIGKPDEVDEKMTGLFTKIESPLLTGVQVKWPDGVTAESYPARIPDLYRGEPVLLSARLNKGAKGRVELSGFIGETPWATDVSLDAALAREGVAPVWARTKIREIERAGRKPGGPAQDKVRADILNVALPYSQVSRFTSLVAVDKTPAPPSSAALDTAAVPTNLPSDMDPNFAKGGVTTDAANASQTAAAPVAPAPQEVLRIQTASADAVQLPNTALGISGKVNFGFALMFAALIAFALFRQFILVRVER